MTGASEHWDVLWLPEAIKEREAARPDKEIKAMMNAAEKLEHLGLRISSPHVRDVKGSDGLWELRPRGGRSKWRPIYKRMAESTFVILAVAPEVETNKRGYNLAIKNAEKRALELAKEDD